MWNCRSEGLVLASQRRAVELEAHVEGLADRLEICMEMYVDLLRAYAMYDSLERVSSIYACFLH